MRFYQISCILLDKRAATAGQNVPHRHLQLFFLLPEKNVFRKVRSKASIAQALWLLQAIFPPSFLFSLTTKSDILKKEACSCIDELIDGTIHV